MPPSTAQNISAGKELLTAVRLFASGLGQLESLDDGASDFFHLPLLALQQGLERWVKISLCFHYLKQNAEFPGNKCFRRGREGHNIQPLLDNLVSLAYTPEFEVKHDYVKRDREFLESKHFREYVTALSEFGVSSRYFHLNTVLGKRINIKSPEQAWEDVEAKVLDLEYNQNLRDAFYESKGAQEVLQKVLAESRGFLVRCGRALARMLVLGALGEEAKRYYGYVSKFCMLSDDELLTVKFEPFHKNI